MAPPTKEIRYIGSKEKLLPFLAEHLFPRPPSTGRPLRFLDGFAGTSVVGRLAQQHSYEVSLADLSYYSKALSSRLFGGCLDKEWAGAVLDTIEAATLEPDVFFNEFSKGGVPTTANSALFSKQTTPSRLFFSAEAGAFIDTYRSIVIKSGLPDLETNYLLSFLLKFADKNANNTSVFGAYLKRENIPFIPFDFKAARQVINGASGRATRFIQADILAVLDMPFEYDVIYLDPPYTTRRYESNYHILNYICNPDFNATHIKPGSKTGLPLNNPYNAFGSKKGTRYLFPQMIRKALAHSPKVVLSYSTDGELTVSEIHQIAIDLGVSFSLFEQDYKKFKSKVAASQSEVKELVYVFTQ